jgi:SWI/SNF-related matrix-associated actin-dependent regulator 1 of chromatin subfamily A
LARYAGPHCTRVGAPSPGLASQAAGLPDGADFDKRRLLTSMVTELGRAKARAAAEYALTLLEGCGKVLFFAHHRTMLDALEQAAAEARVRCLRIDGATPADERQALVRTFQSLPADESAIFALSVTAAGQGLTLTAASTVVFGELRWVPGELLQA